MTTRLHPLYEPVDRRIVLSTLWVAVLLVFAYVDLFAFFRADVLEAALDGSVAGTPFPVGQVFLSVALGYVLVPVTMVVLSLLLPPRANRRANLVASLLYAATIVASCIGETWVYYLLGSAVETGLLLTVATLAWRWQPVVAGLAVRADRLADPA